MTLLLEGLWLRKIGNFLNVKKQISFKKTNSIEIYNKLKTIERKIRLKTLIVLPWLYGILKNRN